MSSKDVSPNPQDVSADTFDSHIIPAETAARKEREQKGYKEHNEYTAEEQKEGEINTDGGYTVDKEGLVNNYAIEPEMYYEVPGDLKAKEEELATERAAEMAEVNDTDETGKLTDKNDNRGRGTGII
ncbi:hypothetical protein IFO70_27300 [Phormidium tenue FACHB-886]|nr:hypothetical protein [Phormidium tenue FACHB-886]